MIVRWGLGELPATLAEVNVRRPYVVASRRWSALELPVDAAGAWHEVPSDRVADLAAETEAADGLLAVGGGSAIDLAKAATAATGLPLVSVPTTYSGAEWTTFFGVRAPDRRMRGGGAGARPAAIVYEPELTLALPCAETVGTALNALAHCAEALYVVGRNGNGDRHALAGAAAIGRWLPAVVDRPEDLDARTSLLRGAADAGAALGAAGLGLGHAMAQVLGGRYGLPHGAVNALCLPPALRFNEPVARAEIARFAAALETPDAASRVEDLARLGGFHRLRDLGVPPDELDQVAAAVIERPGAQTNPRQATAGEVADLLRSIW